MKTRSLLVMMMFVLPFIFVNCGKNEVSDGSFDFKVHDYRVENVLYPKGSKLKNVYHQNRFYAEYKYDEANRISRINYGDDIYAYEIYQYNSKGELEKISSYVNLNNSPVLNHTYLYSYDAIGNKVTEQIDFTDNRETVNNLYNYSGGKLTKQEHYEGNKQTHYIIYEYKSDKLVKEKFFVPGEKDFITTEYLYEEGLLVYSITYSGNPESGFGRDERDYYDKNDNLIKRVANIPGLSSYSGATAFYVTWEYDYE